MLLMRECNKKIEKMEERMQQRMLEKFNAQKEAMEQDIMMNVVIRLQRINPDLRLDPGMLIFNARTLGEAFSAQVVIQPINRPSTGSNNQGSIGDGVHAGFQLASLLGFAVFLGWFWK